MKPTRSRFGLRPPFLDPHANDTFMLSSGARALERAARPCARTLARVEAPPTRRRRRLSREPSLATRTSSSGAPERANWRDRLGPRIS